MATKNDIEMKNGDEKDLGNWRALESNPESFNEFVAKLGVIETVDAKNNKKYKYGFEDYYGLELLAMMPLQGECVGAVYLFQDGFGTLKELNKDLAIDSDEKAQYPRYMDEKKLKKNSLFYTKQVDGIGDACGAIACIHTLSNVGDCGGVSMSYGDKAPLDTFLKKCKDLTWDERGEALLQAKDIQEQSEAAADSDANQTAATESGKSQGHFVAFIKDGKSNLIELDGRKGGPINHGPIEMLTKEKNDINLAFFTKIDQITQKRFVQPILARFEQYKLDSAKERFQEFQAKMMELFSSEIKAVTDNALGALADGGDDKVKIYQTAEDTLRKGLEDLKKKLRYGPPQAPGAVLLPLTIQQV